jgi:hypothetical protein
LFEPVCAPRGAISFTPPRPCPMVRRSSPKGAPQGQWAAQAVDRLAVRKSHRHAVRESRRGRPWRRKCGLYLKPQCGPKTGPHYGRYISAPLQKERSRVSKLDRIAVPNQDRVFNCWGGSAATTWLRILESPRMPKSGQIETAVRCQIQIVFSMAGAAPRPAPGCGFLTCRRPIVDGAACSACSCHTCWLAWPFRFCAWLLPRRCS